jgi:hypothetical protein
VDKKRWHIKGVEGHGKMGKMLRATEPYENPATWRMSVANQYASSNLGYGGAALPHMSERVDRVGRFSDTQFTAGGVR